MKPTVGVLFKEMNFLYPGSAYYIRFRMCERPSFLPSVLLPFLFLPSFLSFLPPSLSLSLSLSLSFSNSSSLDIFSLLLQRQNHRCERNIDPLPLVCAGTWDLMHQAGDLMHPDRRSNLQPSHVSRPAIEPVNLWPWDDTPTS